MKIMDFIMQMSFRKDHEGNEVFFPWGIFGKGRIIDNPKIKDEVRKFLRLYYIGMLLLIVPWLFFVQPYFLTREEFWSNLLVALGLIVLSLIWQYFGLKRLIRNLPESTLKMKVRDNLKETGNYFHPILIVALGLVSLMFVVAGFCMLSAGQTIIGLAAIIFFGLCAIVYGSMLFLRLQKDDSSKT